MKDKVEIWVSLILCIKVVLEVYSCNFLIFDIVRNDVIIIISEFNLNVFGVLMKNVRL